MAADSLPDLRSLADSLFAQVTCRQFLPDARVTEHVARRRPQTDYPAFVSSREFTCERRSSFSAASPRSQPRSSRSGRLSAQLSHECLSTHSFSQEQMHPAETNFVFVCFFYRIKRKKRGKEKQHNFCSPANGHSMCHEPRHSAEKCNYRLHVDREKRSLPMFPALFLK